MRLIRVACGVLVAVSTLVAPRPAAASNIDGFAGVCTASGSISWSPSVGTLPAATTATFSIFGACDVVDTDGRLSRVPFGVQNAVTGPAVSCAAGVLVGRPKITVGTTAVVVTAQVVNADGVLTFTGVNDAATFVAVGELKASALGCPTMPSSGWSATFVVEDPTIPLDDLIG